MEARAHGTDLLSVEERIWWAARRSGQTVEGLETGECPTETAGRRPFPRSQHPERGGSGTLLSPARRREAVQHAVAVLAVSERRACRVIGQCRATQHYIPHRPNNEAALRQRIGELARTYGRSGSVRITALLRQEGWRANHTRVERTWREEGLKMPQKHPKRARLWLTDGACVRRRPEHPHHVWASDVVRDRTHDARPVKMLTVVDE